MPHEIKKIMRLIFYLLRALKNQLQQNSNSLATDYKSLATYFSITATTSISTKAFFGKVLTATAERAGNGSLKKVE